jgi:uncharacterized protein YjdB
LARDTASLVRGASLTLVATPRDAAGNPLSRNVAWISSDATKVRVDSLGVVTGVAVGTARIVATSEGKSATATVSVKEGALVGASGANLSALGGVVTLSIPAGALTASTMITIEQTTSAPADPRLVPETLVHLGPPGAAFGRPVTLGLRYDPARVPTGPPARLLAIHRADSSSWIEVPGAVADVATRTVRADLSTVGRYAVLAGRFVESVAVEPATSSMAVGQSLQLTTHVLAANGDTLREREVSWTSSSPMHARVSSSGVVTAVAAGGPVAITALVEGVRGSALVSIGPPTPAPVASVTVAPNRSTIHEGASLELTSIERDSSDNVLAGRTKVWTSSNAAIASVSPAGLVTGVSAGGPVTVSATSEGVTGSAVVTVVPVPVARVVVTPATASVLLGASAQLSASAYDSSGKLLHGRSYVWKSSNPTIASVSPTGIVTGVGLGGPVSIIARSEGISGSSMVSVLAVPVAAVTVTPATSSIAQGASTQLISTERDSAGNVLTGRQRTWTSSDPAVASVSSTGLVTGVSPGGPVTITSTSEGVAGTASVSVLPPPGAITLSTPPTPLTVAPGFATSVVLQIGRSNYAGIVTLSATSQSSGVTVVFSSSSTLGNSATVTITTSSSVPLGSHVVAVTATGTGVVAATVTISFQATYGHLGPSKSRVAGRQLFAQRRNPDGSLAPEFAVRFSGVNYSPAGVGTLSGNPAHRRDAFDQWSAIDIPLMKAMNVNVVRLYIHPGVDPILGPRGLRMLDRFYAAGIWVVMSADDGAYSLSNVSQVVSYYKNHPAVLMFNLANELNIAASFCTAPNVFYGCAAASVGAAASLVESSAALINTLDPNHVVSASYGEIDIQAPGLTLSDTKAYVASMPHVAVWGLQIYRGASFGNLFSQWASIATAPMWISEFGTDAFRTTQQSPLSGMVDESMQAQWDLGLWTEIWRNLVSQPHGVALGGAVMEWQDEWWKSGNPGVQDLTGCGPPNCSGHPDSFSSEEWHGVCRIDRSCRQVYNTLKAAFAPGWVPPPTTVTLSATSVGAAVPGAGLGFVDFSRNGVSFYNRGGGAGGGRGFNVAAFAPSTLTLLEPPRNFDTWGTRHTGTEMQAFVNYLNGLPAGAVVLIGVADEAGLNVDNACTLLPYPWTTSGIQKLQSLGSSRIASYCFRDSWTMVATIGSASAKAEQLGHSAQALATWVGSVQ